MYSRFSSYSQNKSVQVPRTYPEDIDCIIKSNEEVGSLYISNVEAAENIATLRRLKIGAVLTCAKGHQLSHPRSVVPYYKYVPAVDSESCDLSADFDKAVDFIVDTLKKTNVLVHCLAGVSRSVSMVIAYFIREHGMDYPTA